MQVYAMCFGMHDIGFKLFWLSFVHPVSAYQQVSDYPEHACMHACTFTHSLQHANACSGSAHNALHLSCSPTFYPQSLLCQLAMSEYAGEAVNCLHALHQILVLGHFLDLVQEYSMMCQQVLSTFAVTASEWVPLMEIGPQIHPL